MRALKQEKGKGMGFMKKSFNILASWGRRLGDVRQFISSYDFGRPLYIHICEI